MLATALALALIGPLASPSTAAPCAQRWIVNSGSLRAGQDGFPLEEQQKYLDSPCTFLVVGKKPAGEYQDWKAVRTRSITSLSGLEAAANDPSVGAVLYDPEAWRMTPPAEQHDPAGAACKAADYVHSVGKLLIVAPATNLVRFLAPRGGRGDRRYATFEKTGLAAAVAKCADVYDIQAQGSEGNVKLFHDFVAAEAVQAREANPKEIVLAGISTNPNGRRVTAKRLLKAVQSVEGVVDGFWLNIPSGGEYCPDCGQAQPQVAAQLLRKMGRP